ncbi:PREDICTED: E3 ubiquitin-protein ligase TRIM56-like [Branchiostoma belcheri]|uniref:E3 ubiquitin-protein ligase TRIM56-like n=1 Tax=Branchiostoma belcheri TaxID=7741 RepID=A0A6P4YVF1_BRABE|nr:PREDICTED: E3 ubiquitin-protein ligase TRIM56-like [Branchiostoma belcheri]
MAKELLEEITERFLVCSVCLEEYDEPKTLPCSHCFCRKCLENVLDSAKEGRKRTRLCCPSCRQEARLYGRGVQELEDSQFLRKLQKVVSSRTAMLGDAARACCGLCQCKEAAATAFCKGCEHYLCEDCSHTHRVISDAASEHELLQVSGQECPPAEGTSTPTRSTEEQRQIHLFLCAPCELLVCLHCVVTSHRGHAYVELREAIQRERRLASRRDYYPGYPLRRHTSSGGESSNLDIKLEEMHSVIHLTSMRRDIV